LSSQRVINEELCKSALCWSLCYGDIVCSNEKQIICNL